MTLSSSTPSSLSEDRMRASHTIFAKENCYLRFADTKNPQIKSIKENAGVKDEKSQSEFSTSLRKDKWTLPSTSGTI